MSAILTQQHRDKQGPLDFNSKRLDPVMCGHPSCIRSLTVTTGAVELAVLKIIPFVECMLDHFQGHAFCPTECY